jgi:hypothetical protein
MRAQTSYLTILQANPELFSFSSLHDHYQDFNQNHNNRKHAMIRISPTLKPQEQLTTGPVLMVGLACVGKAEVFGDVMAALSGSVTVWISLQPLF